MLSCESALERMSEALDAPLLLEARLELEEHLAACPQCRAAYQALTQMEEVLRGIGETPAPPELSARVMASIQAETVKPRRPLPFWRQTRWRTMAGFAACAMLCVGLYWGMNPNTTTSVSTAPAESGQLSSDGLSRAQTCPEDTVQLEDPPQTQDIQEPLTEEEHTSSAPYSAYQMVPAPPAEVPEEVPESRSASAGTSAESPQEAPAALQESDAPAVQETTAVPSDSDGAGEETPVSAGLDSSASPVPQEESDGEVSSPADPGSLQVNTSSMPPWGDCTALTLAQLPEETLSLLPDQDTWNLEEDGTRWCTVTAEDLEAVEIILVQAGVETDLPEPPWSELCAVVLLPAEDTPANSGEPDA